MKNICKILIFILTFAVVLSSVGCTKVQTVTSEVWEDEETYSQTEDISSENTDQNTSIKDTTSKQENNNGNFDFKGSTVTISSWGDKGAEPDKTSTTYKQEIELIDKIEKKYNCKIEYPFIADSIKYYNSFVTQSMSGTKFADIVAVPGDQGFPSAALSGYARCLDGQFDWDSEMFVDKVVNDALLLKGKHYYLSFAINNAYNSGGGIAFRKSLFQKFNVKTPHDYIKANNWNWNTFKELCKTMTRNEGGTQYYGIDKAKSAIWFSSNNANTILKMGEGKYQFNMNAPEVLECIQFGKDLYDAGYAPKSNGDSLWDAGLIAMQGSAGWVLTAEDDIGFAYYPIGPNANDYVYRAGAGSITVVPTTVKDSIFTGVCQVIKDYYGVYPWRKTIEQVMETRHSDEYSIQIELDMVNRANTTVGEGWDTYYPWTYSNVFWTDYGISEGKSPQAFIDSVKDAAQAEIDSLWSGIDKLE